MKHPKLGRQAAWLVLGLAPTLALGQELKTADEYRAALQDKFANPATVVADQGEVLFKKARGPKNVSLEKCDFGKGAGVLKGAYAELPRYFKDTNKVEDVESRLVTCMVNLQGFSAEEIKKKTFADQRANEANTELEAMALYVSLQSDGMKINPPLKHAKEKEARAVGEALFFTRHGPMDFSCASCHGNDGKRIRLQELGNYAGSKADAQKTMLTWPTYRVSHGAARNLQHRMWDCNWQMRLPDLGYASPASVAFISYLAHQAKGAELNIPGIKR